MKPKKRSPISRCVLKFDKDYDDLKNLRNEISSCLITGENLWVSYDEGQGIERLTRKDDAYKYTKHEHYEVSDFIDLPADDEVDMEGLAYAEPYLWFCGSMSHKRGKPDPDDDVEEQFADLATIKLDDNRFNCGRIPCLFSEEDGLYHLQKEATWNGQTIHAEALRGGRTSSELHNALMRDEHLGAFMTVPCKENGFDIEGLAVHEDRIFFGLRGPVINGWAVIVEITCDVLNGELIMQQRDGEDRLYRKHLINLSGKGIREINIDRSGDLYLLAGPTMDLDGTISIYRIKEGLENREGSIVHAPERLFDVARGAEIESGYDKAEGMAFVSDREVLIAYDAPLEHRLKGKRKVEMDVYSLDNV